MSGISTSDSDDEFFLDMLYHLPRPRLFRDRSNPLEEFDDFDFKCRFRLSKESFCVLILIVQGVKHESKRNVALSPEVQVLITLRYYATGTFQAVIGDHIRVNKSTVCRTIKRVSTAIARLYPQFINMPRTAHERSIVQTGFYKIRNLPRVIGAIDCTHIRIQSPNSDIGERFRNRKGWPGSVHDSTIFDNYLVRAKFENQEYGNNVFLIGDGGYPY
ncbi:putative nuclease HARBI1 [Acyrthosiphon pisum]|uniref:Nuclease HARBI1 n=1 Tax=Acyrthosiphon pisum TaxID=7029 RepID=A0A8R2NJL1_ACYPI|nr:putative nuclease HARBI1 [Acyrthosiphon pisum]